METTKKFGSFILVNMILIGTTKRDLQGFWLSYHIFLKYIGILCKGNFLTLSRHIIYQDKWMLTKSHPTLPVYICDILFL